MKILNQHNAYLESTKFLLQMKFEEVFRYNKKNGEDNYNRTNMCF